MKRKYKVNQFIKQNKQLIIVLIIMGISFMYLVEQNRAVTEINKQGLKLLNQYEYPTGLQTGRCMDPYDVGDGVVTFGPGLTYSSIDAGIADINNNLNKSYSQDNSCIRRRDLFKLQQNRITEYENIVLDVERQYNIEYSQDQFNALVLLAYNSPSLFKNDQFIAVIVDSNSTLDQYVYAADNYYQTLNGYDQTFGRGWYKRIVDSAQVYYNGEYEYQNSEE